MGRSSLNPSGTKSFCYTIQYLHNIARWCLLNLGLFGRYTNILLPNYRTWHYSAV